MCVKMMSTLLIGTLLVTFSSGFSSPGDSVERRTPDEHVQLSADQADTNVNIFPDMAPVDTSPLDSSCYSPNQHNSYPSQNSGQPPDFAGNNIKSDPTYLQPLADAHMSHLYQSNTDLDSNLEDDNNMSAGSMDTGSTLVSKLGHPSYKIFVYELPPKFNADLLPCIYQIMGPHFPELNNQGFGQVYYQNEQLSIHDTDQFSLEVIIHNKFLLSPLRTMDIHQADLVYVPFYSSMASFCLGRQNNSRMIILINNMFDFISQQESYNAGKPHIMTLGKIEREHSDLFCPLLSHPKANTMKYIGIEQEYSNSIRQLWLYNNTQPKDMFVMPYPSYIHYKPVKRKYRYGVRSPNVERNVLVLLAASTRQSHILRKYLFNELSDMKTNKSYSDFTAEKHMCKFVGLWYETLEYFNQSCVTIDWMWRSVFCLQPPGDSPTRKSFYDAILSGCIPVIFSLDAPVKYPFQHLIDYSRFTVTIDQHHVETDGLKVIDFLNEIDPSKIEAKQAGLAKVAQYLQYSYSDENIIIQHEDAMKYLLAEIGEYYKL